MKRILNIMFPLTGLLLLACLGAMMVPGLLEKLNPAGASISNWWLVFFAVAIFALFLAIDLFNRVQVYMAFKRSNEVDSFWKEQFPAARMKVMRVYLGIVLLSALAVLMMVFWAGGEEIFKSKERTAWIWWGIKVLSIVIGLGVLFMFNTVNSLYQGERLVLGKEAVAETEKEGFWGKLFQIRATSTDNDVDLKHDFDGISELDNPPPPWFMYLFYTTILFGVVYMVRYQWTGQGLRQEQEYAVEMKAAAAREQAMLANAAEKVDESNVTLITDKSKLGNMAAVFVKNCAVCHGKNAEGLVGPNLTDEYWIYGGDIKNLFKTIRHGTPNGMQKFDGVLKPSQIQLIASYVLSLQGSNPPNPKAPQGEKYTPVTASANQADSSTAKDQSNILR
ncbi:MAG: c-type cytochrome [Bacteroidetes bacterium]|nr:c-type cytochrome [Bacteroidota bacterium]